MNKNEKVKSKSQPKQSPKLKIKKEKESKQSNNENKIKKENLKKNPQKNLKNKEEKLLNKKTKKNPIQNLNDSYSDSSDEEVLVRTGDVPIDWYDSYEHIGYDINSKKVQKNKSEDEIESFLTKAKDKNWWRNIYDPKNNKTVFLSDKDLNIINRIRNNLYASKSVSKEEYFEDDVPKNIFPLSNHLRSKKSFGLSKNERKIINRLIYLYQNALMQIDKPEKKEDDFYDMWEFEDDENALKLYRPNLNYEAPKRDLPLTEESYNPPNSETGGVLRRIPRYEKLIDEELERCCDLFLSSRAIRKKLDLKESDILPELPKPEELRPFPTKETIIYKGHESSIKAMACHEEFDVLISADNANFVHFWDILTAKIFCRISLKERVYSIRINHFLNLVVICCVSHIFFLLPKYLCKRKREEVLSLVKNNFYPLIKEKNKEEEQKDKNENIIINDAFIWKIPKKDSPKEKSGILFYQKWNQGKLKDIVLHSKGDYFATLSKNSQGITQVFIHSLTKMSHQVPISHIKGNVNAISFHPNKPYFIVATNSNIFLYNLHKQELVRKFVSNLGTISRIAIHNGGSDLIAGAKDGKISWFQLELSAKPFKTMDYHQGKIKAVEYHNKYPLFSSCSQNGKLLIYYGKITEEELTDPLIVPLKVLKSEEENKGFTCACFHPKMPWIFSGREDGTIQLWS
ncbi:MAG: hypothetical protein MJ252_08150 [archaeon]|nr:hypothetical protein [archaeon]